jgi:hypothetical protein
LLDLNLYWGLDLNLDLDRWAENWAPLASVVMLLHPMLQTDCPVCEESLRMAHPQVFGVTLQLLGQCARAESWYACIYESTFLHMAPFFRLIQFVSRRRICMRLICPPPPFFFPRFCHFSVTTIYRFERVA